VYKNSYNTGIEVRQRDYEDNESLIRRFKKKVSKSGILKEVRDRMYFEKPSAKRRRKKLISINNIRREQEKQLEESLRRKPTRIKERD